MSSPSTPSTPPASFEDAVALFNQRQFFECHEVLEDLWRPLPKGPEKWFLQGLLQVGVGFHHLEQLNYTGAKSLLNSGVEKLEMIAAQKAFSPPIDLHPLVKSSRAALETVVVLGPDCLEEFPESLIPQVTLL
jgi:predicted metal-dependent hydrolase